MWWAITRKELTQGSKVVKHQGYYLFSFITSYFYCWVKLYLKWNSTNCEPNKYWVITAWKNGALYFSKMVVLFSFLSRMEAADIGNSGVTWLDVAWSDTSCSVEWETGPHREPAREFPPMTKVMWRGPDMQRQIRTRGAPWTCSSIYPKTRICLSYYFVPFTNSSDINRGLSPTTFLWKKST